MPLNFWRSKTAAATDFHGDREPAPMAAALMQPLPEDFVRLVFLGDLAAANNRAAPIVDSAIVGTLQSADLVIANCDSPVVRRPHLPVRSWLRQRRHMDAGGLLGVISAMSIDTERLILSVANDFALDQSVAGFEETLDTLDALRVRVIGAARRGLLQRVSIGPLNLGLVAFSDWRSGPWRRFRRRVITTEDIPETDWLGAPGVRPDLVCAFPHWGRENTKVPGVRTQTNAARLAERGVGLIAGHHQRFLQPVERIGHAYVAYGLGMFHGPSSGGNLAQRIGGMLVVDISTAAPQRGGIAAYELFPFVRLVEGNREHIVPLDRLPQRMRSEAEAALVHVSGPPG